MSNEEILDRIGRDVTDIYGDMFSKRDITIWMTKGLFTRLFPKQFILQKDTAMITLFGCSLKVVIFPYAGDRWIVGYEGTAND
ncbi:MAG: hypothetical protein IJ899_03115 [Blautia sp.]|nr:hypothetical protein [Blautia sp.]